MIERLIKFIESNHLFAPNDTLLVGVSGGIDSVVLVDLLYHAGLAFAIAHCNFNLRGKESDQDEIFVKSLAAFYDKQYFHQSFNTVEVAQDRGISVEMAARDLRYTWFEETRKNHHFDWIVVAHHRDDQVESFMLNLARGTGISGLTGMKIVNGKIVRPILFVSRKEVEEYAESKHLHFREDCTNALTDFQRNKIRHLVLPLMEDLNPSFRDSMIETISHLRDTSAIYFQAIERARELVVRKTTTGDPELSVTELKLLNPVSAYLFELLKPYHFNSDVVHDLVQVLDGQSGKQFFSATHRAVLDRDRILIQKLLDFSDQRFYLEEECNSLEIPVKLSISMVIREPSFKMNTSSHIACLDKDRLQFPLILRKWQKGDYFQPLGMDGMKKLSDFFVDEKFSLLQKEKTWLLTNGEEIIWIVGERLDNRYKVTSETKNILIVKLD